MDKNKKKIKINKFNIYYLLIILASVFLFTTKAQAASMYISPSSGNYNIGNSFSVGVFVSSADQAMNALSGALSFSSDKLSVTSVSKSGSVISLWVQDPSYSNSAGTVNFEGIVLNPGYTGSAGRIVTVNFKIKAPGTANITFSSGSILANDGQGTSILEGLGSASFAIDVPVTGPVADQSSTSSYSGTVGTLAAPKIYSSTHPYSDAWYNINIPSFNWDLPSGASAARLLVGEKPQASPTVIYAPAVSDKTLEELDDGMWYFHVQLRNSAGWGAISHFRFQIDTQNPESFIMTSQEEDDLTHPHRTFLFEAQDSGSGIDHYEIKIDDEPVQKWEDDGSHIYETPSISYGHHTIIVKAVDQAGNFITNVSDFIIDPLEPVVVLDYPTQLTNKDPFIVKGISYPNAQTTIYLQRGANVPIEYTVQANEIGKFTFIADEKLQDGIYKLSASAVDDRGAHSESTEPITILIEPTRFWKIGTMAIDTLSVLIPIMALIFSTIILILFSLRRLKRIKSRLLVEVEDAHRMLQKEMKFLKIQLNKHRKVIKKTTAKKSISKAEEAAIEVFRKDIINSIERVDSHISNIKTDLK